MDKDAYYFPHFSNARGDRKIQRVRKELGPEGYAIYFMLLEVLRDQEGFKYPLSDIDLLADDFGTSEQKVRTVIANYQLFQVDGQDFFTSFRFHEYMAPYLQKKERARQAAMKRWHGDAFALPGQSKSSASKEEKRREEKSKPLGGATLPDGSLFESSRAYWNSRDNLPQYPYMPLQIPVDKYRNALNAMSPFGAEEINAAIANYSRLLPRLRFKYGTFLNFMTSGLVQFVDSAKPDELFPEDEKTAEERRQAEAWEREKEFRRERGEDI
jgi:hypothetical protein